MNYPVVFSSKAGGEAIEQAAYLEEQRTGYGHKFNQSLKTVISQIGENPQRYPSPIARPDMRCIRMPKPFNKSHSIYYKFDGEIVRILCVFPNRRSESIWQER